MKWIGRATFRFAIIMAAVVAVAAWAGYAYTQSLLPIQGQLAGALEGNAQTEAVFRIATLMNRAAIFRTAIWAGPLVVLTGFIAARWAVRRPLHPVS